MAFSELIGRQVLNRWGDLAADFSVNPPLLLAFVAQESGGNQFAERPEPKLGDSSRGLAQVLTGTLRQMQTEGRVPTEWTSDDLWNPQINLQVAEAIITRQIARWSGDLPRAIASYNAGINIRRGDPLTLAVPGYVESVLAYYSWFLGQWQPQTPHGALPETPGPVSSHESPPEGTGGTPTEASLGGAGVVIVVLLVAVALWSR